MKHKLKFSTKNKLQKIFFFVLLIFLNISNAQVSWQKLNGPLSPATPYSFLITSDGTQFVGTDGRGIFRSVDNGNTWELKNNGVDENYITCIAQAPNDDIYIGTNGYNYCLRKSSNNGESWSGLINNDPDIYDIKFNALGYVLVGSQYGMYISTDNGNSWDLRNSGLSNYNVLSVLPISDSAIIVSTNDGIHYTTNNGLSWTPRNNGLVKVGNYYRTNNLVYYNNIVYVSCGNGLYYSTNYGGNWIQKTSLLDTKNLQIDNNGDFYLIQEVQKKMLRSSDLGSSWDIIYNFQDYITFFKIFGNKIFIGVYTENLLKSTDSGISFVEHFSKPFFPLEISCIKWLQDSLLLAGTYGFGVYSTNNFGQSWKRLGPLKYGASDLKANENGEIFVNCSEKLHISTDYGITWSQIPSQITWGIKHITISKNNEIYTSHREGFFSKLNEENHLDTIGRIRSSDYTHAASFIVDKFGDSYINMFYGEYGGGSYYRTYISQDSFKTFRTLFYFDNQFACDDSGFVYLGNTNIYRTKDRGTTFELKNDGINNLKVHTIKVIDNQEIYIGDINSLYLSTNQGEYWNSIPGPPSANGIHSIEKIGSGSLLIASKNGIYKNLNLVSVEDFEVKKTMPYTYLLNQNHPNPFNPSTIISYQLPVAGNVTLKVFDVLGREVATLVDEYRNAGSYDVEFNPESPIGAGSIKNPASGVYFYQLKAGEFVETKKMILLR